MITEIKLDDLFERYIIKEVTDWSKAASALNDFGTFSEEEKLHNCVVATTVST